MGYNIQKWYLEPWISSIHSFDHIHTKGGNKIKNTQIKESDYTTPMSEEKSQPKFKNME